ncbi:DeoR/GlpR family DNA-binding transcription regulator [uncultured Bartonella sp.]|uniref:DeoR/GlpR family DNA-binding transcription regulator n=1 Tax=uncultured Bartonella sp. TaxID=104108 RepID=UPI00260976A0|nr:DeoR/GlpR family DNA-binding transcription regulator [uncultured Bartonella sp.]
MNRKKRLSHLIKALTKGAANVEKMANNFGVSASTIRRDLQFLAQNGSIQRTYGGAVLNHAAPEISYVERMARFGESKRAIAARAVELIKDGDTIMLDAGSTICALGMLLKQRKVDIITNNLMLVPIFEGATNLNFTVLGGKCRKTSMGIFGSLALKNLEYFTADLFFTSADGIAANMGLCEASLEQTVLKETMMKHASKTVVLADFHKINRAEQHYWAKLPSSFTLVTDKILSEDEKNQFAMAGATVLHAASDESE